MEAGDKGLRLEPGAGGWMDPRAGGWRLEPEAGAWRLELGAGVGAGGNNPTDRNVNLNRLFKNVVRIGIVKAIVVVQCPISKPMRPPPVGICTAVE